MSKGEQKAMILNVLYGILLIVISLYTIYLGFYISRTDKWYFKMVNRLIDSISKLEVETSRLKLRVEQLEHKIEKLKNNFEK